MSHQMHHRPGLQGAFQVWLNPSGLTSIQLSTPMNRAFT
jgi:hypothetical protein